MTNIYERKSLSVDVIVPVDVMVRGGVTDF